ncbi:MAG TPA: RluA family pseudouridine synthase [Clostridiales bacterium]|nr:RluA family pseudouridine synthase [Clostridiales bacterium]
MRTVELTVDASQPMRIDQYIAGALNITRSSAAKLIEENYVLLNDKPVAKKTKVKTGDRLAITMPEPKPLEVEKQDIPLDIVYEDDWLLVVNKPKGMVVHPAPGNPDGTLVNALLNHCGDSLSGINGVLRPGIVHRIDKNTSGLLVVAKNDIAHNFLSRQIKMHSFTREYEAVVIGNLKSDSGKIDAPIGRHPVKRKQMAVVNKNSKHAVTYYYVLNRYNGYTHVRLKLETGRTHQIRVHMAYIGHPVAGDDVYGPKKDKTGLNGQCLHAKKIGFIHPFTKEYLEFECPLPDYFTDFLNKISSTI